MQLRCLQLSRCLQLDSRASRPFVHSLRRPEWLSLGAGTVRCNDLRELQLHHEQPWPILPSLQHFAYGSDAPLVVPRQLLEDDDV